MIVLVKVKPLNFIVRRLKTGLFYLHLALLALFSWILLDSGNSMKNVIFPMLSYPILFSFFIIRNYIFLLEIDEVKIRMQWLHWFRVKSVEVAIKNLDVNIKTLYQTNGATLIIKGPDFIVRQTLSEVWTKELMEHVSVEIRTKKERLIRANVISLKNDANDK